jgi:outer membrane protein assembly factor BamD (BamD/ComL family)
LVVGGWQQESASIQVTQAIMAQPSPALKRHGRLWGSLLLTVIILLISISILHYQGNLRLALLQIGDDSATSGLALNWSFWAQPVIDGVIWLLLGLAIILILICAPQGWSLCVGALVALLIVIVVAAAELTRFSSIHAQVMASEQTVYQNAIDAFRSGDYGTAAAKFERLQTAAKDESLRLEASGWLSGVHYQQHAVEASLTHACTYARQATPAQRYWKPNIITLHWAIYELGRTSPTLDEAIQRLDDLVACMRVAEASHFWLTISPGLYVAITDAAYFDTATLNPATRAALRQLLDRYPHETAADLALLALGDYDRLIRDYPESALLDRAYYARAMRADENGDLEAARLAYQAFIDRFPENPRTLRTIQRVGNILKEQGDLAGALAYFLQAPFPAGKPNEADGYTTHFRADILYLLDVEMSVADVRHFIELHPAAPAPALLRFSLAAKLLAEDRYAEAQTLFQALAQSAPADSKLHRLSQNNLDKIALIQSSLNSTEPEALPNLAQYLLQDQPVFYNELWGSRRRTLEQRGAPWAYYLQHNDHLRAITLLQRYLDQQPDASRTAEALFMLGKAYAELGGSNAFLPFDAPLGYDVKAMRQKAVDTFTMLLQRYPNSFYFDEALAKTGLVYIEDEPIDPESAIKQFRALAQNYPTHRLANNALNWVAYLECGLAAQEETGSTLWREKFQQAQADYQVILEKYPDGHVGRTARYNIDAIQDALAHPEKYTYTRVCTPNLP